MKREIPNEKEVNDLEERGREGITHLEIYRVVFGLIVFTGSIPIVFGYRDGFMVAIEGFLAVLLGMVHLRIKKRKRPGRVRGESVRVGKRVLLLVFIILGVFMVTDHVRIAVMTATVQREMGWYTTVARCQLGAEERVCLHESKEKILLIHFEKNDIVEVEDITDVVRKYDS